MSERPQTIHNNLGNPDRKSVYSRRHMLRMMGLVGAGIAATSLLSACGEEDADDEQIDDDDVAEAVEEPDDDELADEDDDDEPADEDDDDEPADDDDRRGGTFQSYIPEDTPSLDFHADGGQSQTEWSAHTHSRLFMMASGPDVPHGSLDTQPDAAESIDISEDGLTYTVTLRDNVRFHPPLDRDMTSEDVVYTFNYLAGEELVYGITDVAEVPDSRFDRLRIVESIEAVDDLTIEFVLGDPHPFFQSILADPKVMFIHPVEVRDEIDPTQEAIGSGPWILEEYSPGTFSRFRRHDDWHLGPEIPYYDEVELNVVPEYATQLSQFMAGDLDWLVVEPADLPRVQDAVADVQVYEMPAHPLTALNFSARDEHWQDIRLRHAVSMCINRDEMLDAAYGLAQLEQELGEEFPRNWHTNIPVGFSEFWNDPKTEMDPEAAQYLEYNPDRARELVEEAGYPNGFETELHYSSGRYGEPYRIMSELMLGYLGDIGIQTTGFDLDYNAEFLGTDNVSGGNYDGLMWIQQTRVEPFAYFQTQYMSPDHGIYGQWSNDEELLELLDEMRRATDFDELIGQVKNFQEVLIRDKMYVVPMQEGAVPRYRVYQPWVENALDYQSFAEGDATENIVHYWENR